MGAILLCFLQIALLVLSSSRFEYPGIPLNALRKLPVHQGELRMNSLPVLPVPLWSRARLHLASDASDQLGELLAVNCQRRVVDRK